MLRSRKPLQEKQIGEDQDKKVVDDVMMLVLKVQSDPLASSLGIRIQVTLCSSWSLAHSG